MNKSKVQVILYYVCFVITILIVTFYNYKFLRLTSLGDSNSVSILDGLLYENILYYINILLFAVFTIMLAIKKKIEGSYILSICYIVFSIIFVIVCSIYNNKVILENIHLSYYLQFLLVGYLLFNIYSIISIKYKKE